MPTFLPPRFFTSCATAGALGAKGIVKLNSYGYLEGSTTVGEPLVVMLRIFAWVTIGRMAVVMAGKKSGMITSTLSLSSRSWAAARPRAGSVAESFWTIWMSRPRMPFWDLFRIRASAWAPIRAC